MAASLIFGLLFLLLLGLLFIPIEVYFNTITNQYYLRLRGLVKVSMESDEEELLRIRIKVFFRNFHFYPLQKIENVKRKKLEKRVFKKHIKKNNLKILFRLLKSFRVKKMYVNIDTGDCLMNAKLYPLFAFLNYHKGNFNINFEGRNQMVLSIENRPIHIIKSFINF